MQKKQDLEFHPIFFFSKRTIDTESRYHSSELEMLAIIYALRRFRVYLQDIKFKIVTDCDSLKKALNKKDINPKITRWTLELQNYDYTVEHRSGERMKHVDALSRSSGVFVEVNSLEHNLAICQALDPIILEIRDRLERSEDKLFEMRNRLVYCKRDSNLLFYVPEKMESNIIFNYHDLMGHLGREKTVNTISKSYWFPKMNQKVKIHIRHCLKCIAFSPHEGKPARVLHEGRSSFSYNPS
jgi:ribonuclease HI